MRCPVCEHRASPTANFCERCGERLPLPCAHCGAPLSPAAQFCADCGASRAEPASQPEAVAAAGGADLSAEEGRRHITVLFCDLVGATPLAADLDPEDLHALLRRYQEACARVVAEYDGHIAQYLGDGLLVFFGYPRAHEDDAQRAAHAGLGMLGALLGLNEALEAERGIRLAARIGIHSGPVVVGRIGGDERRPKQVFGHTVNLAERLQGVAEADSIVVSSETLRLLRGRFLTETLGRRALRGVHEPVVVHRVLAPADPPGARGEAAGVIRTPLVGRQQDVALLVDRWEQATQGLGQVVLLAGESGMGKSRLVEVLRERIGGEPHHWLQCHCSVYRRNSALYPIVRLVEQGFDLRRDDSAETKLEKIERGLEEKRRPLSSNLPLFAALLSLPLPDRYPALAIDAAARRRRTLEALCGWLLAVAEQQPAVVVVEDLHWVDPSTLELLGTLVEESPAAPLLLLLTFRPTFRPPWGSRSSLSHLMLLPLTRRQVEDMVGAVTAGAALPQEVLRELVAKTDGVPLFVEELTKAVLESALLNGDRRSEVGGRPPALAIPSTLEDSLMARLDRLGPARELAELASVLGREFSHELLEAVASPGSLEADLTRLVSAELLYRRGVPPHTAYTFKHALIQEKAYQSLLKSRRQEFHARVAAVLEARFPERVESEPEELARHHAEAGQWDRAIAYYERAGERATLRSAYAEAVAHLSSGIEMLDRIPETRERNRRELALRISLGPPLIGIRGYADPEVQTTYTRARALSAEMGGTAQHFEAIWGLANFYQARARLALAKQLGEQLVKIAREADDPQLLCWAHLQFGAPHFWTGEYAASLAQLERAIASYDPSGYWFLPGAADPCVAARVYASLVLWQLGRSDRALESSREGIRLAREKHHAFSLGIALCFSGSLHQQRGDVDAVREAAEEVIPLAAEHGFPLWHGWGGLLLGWSLAHSADRARGLEAMQRALAEIAGTGARLGGPAALMVLADAQRAAGRWSDVAASAAGGLDLAEQEDHHAWDAELLRLRGEALLEERGSDEPEVGRCLRGALDTAVRGESKPYELRAAMALCRLLNQRGAKEEAHALLAGATERFPGAFESAEFRQAKALLRKLS